jgi:hypothetical protein
MASDGQGASNRHPVDRLAEIRAEIRDIFETLNSVEPDKKEQQLHSADIVKALGEMEHRPWPEFRRAQCITTTQLARILRKYHITPSQMRIGGFNAKGYDRTQFERAFERYLPPLSDPPPENSSPTSPNGGIQPKHRNKPRITAALGPISNRNKKEPCFGLKNPRTPSVSAVCFDVSDETP